MKRLFIVLVLMVVACPLIGEELSRLRPDLVGMRDPEPRDELTYAQHQGTVVYEVIIQIGNGDGGETYRGELHCAMHERRWQVTAFLKEDGPRKSPIFFPDPFGNRSVKSTENLDYLENVPSCITTFTVTSDGKVQDQSNTSLLHLFLGDLMTLPVVPLPTNNQKKWSVEEPTMVSLDNSSERIPGIPHFPPGFPMGRFAEPRQVAPAIEQTNYRLGKKAGRMVEILHDTSLDASKLTPSCRVSGSGSATFDRHRGVLTELTYERNISVTASGAELSVPVKMIVRLKSDVGLLPLTQKQKEEIAEAKAYAESPAGIAEAKRMEEERIAKLAKQEADRLEQQKVRQAKLDAVLDGDSRQSFIDLFSQAQEFGDAIQALGTLRSVSDRVDKPLADAIMQFANRMEVAGQASHFYDLAAKFDPEFKTVKDLRNQLRNSFHDIAEIGDPVSDLNAGQLVLVKSKYSRGYRPHIVVDTNEASVRIQPLGHSQPIESVNRDALRLPPASVVPYLSSLERGESRSASPFEESEESQHPHPIQVWTDASGRHQVEARFLTLQNGRVRLQRKDGKTVEIAESSLSRDSLSQLQKAIESESPFQLVSP